MRREALVEEVLGWKLRCSFQDGQRPVQRAKPLIPRVLGRKPRCSFQERSGAGGVWRPGCAGVRGFAVEIAGVVDDTGAGSRDWLPANSSGYCDRCRRRRHPGIDGGDGIRRAAFVDRPVPSKHVGRAGKGKGEMFSGRTGIEEGEVSRQIRSSYSRIAYVLWL